MTNPLDTLRPEVREAVGIADNWAQDYQHGLQAELIWDIIRAELLRLADECAMVPRAQLLANFAASNERAEKAEAELAALKARIADAPRVYHSSFEYTLDASTLYARAVGIPGEETYALVKVED